MAQLTVRQRCLIADDQQEFVSLVGDVEAAGFEAVGPFRSVASALEWLATETPEVAVIDPTLSDGTGGELVQVLRNRGVPIMIYSDMPREADAPSELQSVPWFEKATARADLLASLGYLKSAAAA